MINNPKTDINIPIENEYSAIYLSCCVSPNLKIAKLLCEHPKLDHNLLSKLVIITAFAGNFYNLQIIFKYLPTIKIREPIGYVAYQCLDERHLYCLKLLLKYIIDTDDSIDPEKIKRDNYLHYYKKTKQRY